MHSTTHLLNLGLILLASSGSLEAGQKEHPNIVFILADDLGYGDVSCFNPGSKIKTPNIDRIAEKGIRFTDAHSSSAVCTPTRYGILTGRYSWRSTLKQGVLNGYSEPVIPADRTTIASMLKQQGYQTACIGKWHLGWNWQLSGSNPEDVDFSKPIKNGPITLGFDHFFGISASLDMPPYVYVEDDRVTGLPDRQTEGNNIRYGEKGYDGSMWRKGPTGSDFRHHECLPVMTDRAVKYIKDCAVSGKPWFLYLALPAPHTPILPSELFSGKSGLNPYADFVMMVDAKVGEILDAVHQSGDGENTVIVFASDNGCAPWADYQTLLQKGHNPSYIYRGTKADLFDGGHRIPCLMQWPARIKRARTVSQTICLNDFMRTFAEITGYKISDDEAEDSFSLLPVLLNPGYRGDIRQATVHHSVNGDFSIRQGDWKLLFSAGSGGWSHPTPGKEEEGLPSVQLYNLKKDPSEKVNLHEKYPEVVTELKSLMKRYIEEGRSTPGKPQKNDGTYPWKQAEGIVEKAVDKELAGKIAKNEYFQYVKAKALEIMKTGFNAGDGYREVWIRDYNTFIELAAQVFPKEDLKENLLVFCRMQGEDGNIPDGFTPAEKIGKDETDFSYSKLEPRYAAHKNTVETDQESSLIQAVYKYIQLTGDPSILTEKVGDKTVSERLEWAMDFLMQNRFNAQYGLITGATTADWGDVQPEHGWGVDLDKNTHKAIDIYDNAMFVIALNNLTEMLPSTKQKWNPVKESIAQNCRKHLWDNVNKKFIPHIYLENGSPFPADFNESEIFYFGGTAIAIEAGLLSKEEIKISLDEMIRRVKIAGAGSIGLTLYPPYPNGYFANKIMNPEYSYQNGGDWTWFGGRMIQQLIRHGFVQEAYEQVQPMVKRVKDNNGFYEWYSVDNKPRGSGTFRGEAGVLYSAIVMFENLIR